MARVLYLASSYKVGLTALLAEMACALQALGESEYLFVSGEREQFPGLFQRLREHRVRHVAIAGFDDHGSFLRVAREFNREVTAFEPEIVHVQTNWQLGIAVAVRRLFGHRYAIVYTIHGYRHNHKVRSLIARLVIGTCLGLWADWVLMPSSFLRERFAILRRKSSLLFLGVDERFFERGKAISSEEPARIIYPAQFREGKNHEGLIRTVGKVITRTGPGTVELYLPGTGSLMDQCQALCRRLGIEDIVRFPGPLDREELLDLFMKCHLVVVPANVETFGLAIAEGLVLGRVVVSRPVGVAQDVIVHGKTGCLFGSEDELEALLCSLITDRAACEEISYNALAARDVFRWRTICREYEAILAHLTRVA